MAEQEGLNFEASMTRLEEIVSLLERGGRPSGAGYDPV